MYCRHCGSAVDMTKTFCPDCGSRLADQNQNLAPPKKHTTFWFKAILGTIFFGVVAFVVIALLSEDITDSITDQLNAIRQGRITEAYYNYTSKDFQKATSLDRFRDFLNAYPEFSQSQSIRFIERNVDTDQGFLHAKLMTLHGVEAPVEYNLVKEGDKWKIINIKLESTPAAAAPHEEPFDKRPLEKLVLDELDLIHQGKLKEAYDTYSSRSFKDVTSYKEFVEFVREQPGLTESQSAVLNNLTFDNNVALLSGILKARNGMVYPINYDLIQEGGDWKVMHIEVQEPEQQEEWDAATLKITKYVLGNTTDASGIVTDPKTTFKSDSGEIILNLYLTHAKAGTTIEVVFEHVDSTSTIPAVSTHITEDGNATAMFIFSPPKGGWPTGAYRIRVKCSTGLTDTYEFRVI